MKVLHIGKKGLMERYSEKDSLLYQMDVADLGFPLPAEDYLKEARDADFIITDAIAPVTAELIDGMPNLKLIHSEGVAVNSIDTEAAKKRYVYVCNSEGMNAMAVAEQTLLLMVGVLRDVVNGDRAVREGKQIETKMNYMEAGTLRELADCSVGLVGFGHIARSTAKLLKAYGVRNIYYNKRHPLTPEEEAELGVSYRGLPDLLAQSDIVSLHVPVTDATRNMADDSFFDRMKDGSYLINTARGELVDDDALVRALSSGKLVMAGLDTIDREPVQADHPLLHLSPEISRRILFSPHIGGITASSFRRSYAMIWEDIGAVIDGKVPARVVNHW